MSRLSAAIRRLRGRHTKRPTQRAAGVAPPPSWTTKPCVADILSIDPLIVYTLTNDGLRLGLGTVFGDRYGDRPTTFFITPAHTIERHSTARVTHEEAVARRAQYPHHRFVFCCNSPGEVALLTGLGEEAHLINQSLTVPEETFFPIEGAAVEFDAICNGSLWPLKRQELAATIPRVAYITYYHEGLGPKAAVQDRLDLLRHPPPGHRLLNPVSDDLPVAIPAEAVNQAYSRSAVGLCLSPYEGAMRASIEYMLAGLPVVSTPSIGGRDLFYRPEYATIAEPDPDAIRDAVLELQRRAIPRQLIRERTIALLDEHRRALLAEVNGVLAAHGEAPRFGNDWPFRGARQLGRWRTLAAIATEIDAAIG